MNNTASNHYPSSPKAWLSAAILFVLTAIALADRMAISMLIGPIKQDFNIGDFQASLLVGLAFTSFYILFILPIGFAADRFSRTKVLATCLTVWSLASVLCGFTVGFISLFVARMIMGAGEAGIGPCSHGIIGASFRRERLSKPLALQGIGFQVGPALGVAAAGLILSAGAAGAFDKIPVLNQLAPWRIAFILIGLPGFLALFLIPLIHDPALPSNTLNARQTDQTINFYQFFRSEPTLVVLMLVGASVSAIATGVLMAWTPEYLMRVRGVPPIKVGASIGFIALIASVIGQGLFSAVVDWLATRNVLDAPVRAGLLPMAVSIPVVWLLMSTESTDTFYLLLFVLMLCLTPLNSMNNTAMQQLAPENLRSQLSAFMILGISLLGFVIAPAMVGALSEFVLGEAQLGVAMKWVMSVGCCGTFISFFILRGHLNRYMKKKESFNSK